VNEILVDALVGDTYTDALTLGPEPGVMDGCDITIERADVLMQFAVGDTGDVYWQDHEYPMRPGTRHVNEVCGVRFRNKQSGAAAILNAALTGPGQPRLDPIIPLPATGIGDPLVSVQSGGNAFNPTSSFGPFDVGDWPALLIALGLGVTATKGARASALYTLFPTFGNPYAAQLEVWSGPGGGANRSRFGILVVENLLSQVTIELDTSGAPSGAFLVAPCAFTRQQIWQQLGDRPATLLHTGLQNVAAAGNLTFLIPPYKGVGQTSLSLGSTGGPATISIVALDYTGATSEQVAYQQGLAVNNAYIIEHALVPSPMLVTVTNTNAGAVMPIAVDIVIKEPS
jgi:hypothetical protein